MNVHSVLVDTKRVAEIDAHPQPFALRAELKEGGRPRMRYCNSVLYCALADIIGILGHPDNAGRIHRLWDTSRAANATLPGRRRAPNSSRFASQRLCFVRSAW